MCYFTVIQVSFPVGIAPQIELWFNLYASKESLSLDLVILYSLMHMATLGTGFRGCTLSDEWNSNLLQFLGALLSNFVPKWVVQYRPDMTFY